MAEVCEELGIKYNVYPTFTGAIAANYNWLKQMSKAPTVSQIMFRLDMTDRLIIEEILLHHLLSLFNFSPNLD